MIPAIEDIFHALSRGEISFANAEMYVREHIRLATSDELELRDMFAGEAMNGLLSSWGMHDVQDYSEIASDAYRLADAMIKGRAK